MKEHIICRDLEIFGQNLNFICSRNTYTNQQFSELIEYDRSRINGLFLGRQNIRLNTALRIANNSGYSLSSLFNASFIDDDDYRKKHHIKDVSDTLQIFIASFSALYTAHNTSQAKLAEQIDLSAETLSRLLHNKIPNPTIQTMSKLASATNKSLSYLLRKDSL